MSSPSANSGHLPGAFKEKITSLIKEQLKPIVTELAGQQQTLLNNLALLKHNHNVNDYQMNRLEGIRDLEQSVNFKVTGVLGFDPRQHPTMGTNLREPVPADPELIPQFQPIEQATPAERATQSAALIKEAGMSARRIGVPLTMQDFPDHPSMNKGKKEDPMHASVPLFGLNAPRWRAKLGLDNPSVPGTATFVGVVAPPKKKKMGLQLRSKCAKELKVPMIRLMEQGIDALGAGATSSSSSPGAGTSNSPGAQGEPADDTQSNQRTPEVARHATTAPAPAPSPSAAPSAPKPLYRTYAIADMESSISASASTTTSNRVQKPSGLCRTSTMSSIASTTSITSQTSTHSSFSRLSTTATAGSEPPLSPPHTPKVKPAKTKAKAKAKSSTSKQRTKRTKTAAAPKSSTSASTSASISSSTITEQPDQTTALKRGRRTAELEDTEDDMTTDSVEDQEEAEPANKRRKRSVVASDTGSESTARRSTRVTRASTAAPVANAATPSPRPAPRGRATKGKKGNKRS